MLGILEHIAPDPGVSLKSGSAFIVALDHLCNDRIGTGECGSIEGVRRNKHQCKQGR
jgi:hypothetical protein